MSYSSTSFKISNSGPEGTANIISLVDQTPPQGTTMLLSAYGHSQVLSSQSTRRSTGRESINTQLTTIIKEAQSISTVIQGAAALSLIIKCVTRARANDRVQLVCPCAV